MAKSAAGFTAFVFLCSQNKDKCINELMIQNFLKIQKQFLLSYHIITRFQTKTKEHPTKKNKKLGHTWTYNQLI